MTTATEEVRFTTAEVARMLRRNVQTIRRYIREGRLEAEKVNNYDYQCTQAQIDAFLAPGATGATKQPEPLPSRNPKYATR